MIDAFHPARHGRCPRCSARSHGTSAFCLECGLRLRPGMPGLQASARLLSESWMRTNPARADHWIARGAAHSTHNVVISLASPTEVEELECWQLRDRLFESASAPVLGPELPGD